MPTIFSHAVLAGALSVPLRNQENYKKLALAGIFCSMLPDADAIGYFAGIPYSSLWGHRGITHSIFFSVLLSAFFTSVIFKRAESKKWKHICSSYLFLVTVSHPLLDALTNGGLGVALFAPFSNSRYFFPWQPILVSQMGVGFISTRGLQVLLSEFLWIWIPSFLIAAISFRKFSAR